MLMLMDRDMEIRLAAMQRLEELRRKGDGVVDTAALDEGFIFSGERIALWNARRGIWRPHQLRESGAALTIVTAPRRAGRRPAYDDEVGAADRGWFGYKYEGTDPGTWTNAAVRRAAELARPLIYLYGVTSGLYEPIFPVYVTEDHPEQLTFRLEVDVPITAADPGARSLASASPRREYQTVAVKHRLHQHRFRELVLSAYQRRCAMCRLGHAPLLDAAHIIPDHDELGRPEVPNGLALCKIHHGAYDSNILGIDPDLLVHVREDILQEVDGPMLEHGLKGMAGKQIHVPRITEQRPNRDFLAHRFSLFRAA